MATTVRTVGLGENVTVLLAHIIVPSDRFIIYLQAINF